MPRPDSAVVPPSHPGVLLERILQQVGSLRAEFACSIRISPVCLNQIIEGRRNVTADLALRLARATDIGAEAWLAAQQQWDLYDAERLLRDELAMIPKLSGASKRLAA